VKQFGLIILPQEERSRKGEKIDGLLDKQTQSMEGGERNCFFVPRGGCVRKGSIWERERASEQCERKLPVKQ